MKAVMFGEYGDPSVLVEVEVEDPRPGPGEVIVRTSSTSVNRIDTLIRSGVEGYRVALPHVLGSDVAGFVEEVGYCRFDDKFEYPWILVNTWSLKWRRGVLALGSSPGFPGGSR